jgi:hypothetical protein
VTKRIPWEKPSQHNKVPLGQNQNPDGIFFGPNLFFFKPNGESKRVNLKIQRTKKTFDEKPRAG